MKKYIVVFLIGFLMSCTTEKDKMSLYQEAMQQLQFGNFNRAAELFETIEDNQPFTEDAVNGLIMSSYSYYKAKSYDDAIRVVDYFIQANPIHSNLPYLYYIKGLSYYDRIKSMNKGKDIILNADSTFKELIEKFPDTKYSFDAKEKLKTVETFLSGHEMNLANYYLSKRNYLSAMNHYNNIISKYQSSNFVPEALYNLIQITYILDLKIDSIKYYQLLMNNYKDNIWTTRSTNIIKKYENK